MRTKPIPQLEEWEFARFLCYFRVGDPGECWEWRGATTQSKHYKYGCFGIRGKIFRANRLAYHLFVGPIPEGKLILHTCDNPLCVNPAHLFPGTPAENTQDMVDKQRQAMGEKVASAKLTRKQVKSIRTYAAMMPQVDIARLFRVSNATVSAIVSGKHWKHV